MTASWFSGSPNQPPWLYRPTVHPIFAGRLGDRPDAVGLGADAGRLLVGVAGRLAAAHDP